MAGLLLWRCRIRVSVRFADLFSRGFVVGDAVLFEQGVQFAGQGHLGDDVTASNKLAFDIELGNGRPVREILDALTNTFVGQDVHVGVVDPDEVQDTGHAARETALGHVFGAFHVEHDIVALDGFFDLCLCVAHLTLLEVLRL